MSSEITPSKRHRQTRSAATTATSSTAQQSFQTSYYLNSQAFAQNSDAPMSLSPQPTTPPRTPRKDGASVSQNKTRSVAVESGMKNKTRKQNRPKNVNVSPAVTKNERRTPPLSSAGMPYSNPITTPSAAAYAGPTFHASPAPSALPIPSFYSRSVPDSPGFRGLKQNRDVSISSNSELSASPLPAQVSESSREESPLDIFFKADREEKAQRARSASSAQHVANATGPFPPPPSSQNSRTPPATAVQNRPQRWSQDKRPSSREIFAMELDSPANLRSPLGPAFSTPYKERISAARGPSQSSHSQESPIQSNIQSSDKSTLLKEYLFNNSSSQNPYPMASQPTKNYSQAPRGNIFANESKPSTYTPRNNWRSSGLRQEVSPTKTPTQTSDQNGLFNSSPTPSRQYRDNYSSNSTGSLNRSANNETSQISNPSSGGVSFSEKGADMKFMEDRLRSMLNISSPGSGPFGSVINGGRTPPISNGINGVMRS